MHIKRVISETIDGNEDITFETETGLQLKDIIVIANNKRIAADVVELNTVEGWVDVEIPVIKETTTVNAGQKIENVTDEINTFFDKKLRRYKGKIRVLIPTKRKEH